MAIKFLEQWKFRLSGRSVPVFKVSDIGPDGKVLSLQSVGKLKLQANSIMNSWDVKGYEIEPENPGYITFIDEKGTESISRVVSVQGRTVDLYVSPYFKPSAITGLLGQVPGELVRYKPGDACPNREDVLGSLLTMDIIATAMDLGKSSRNYLIGAIFGCAIGMFILGPMLTKMFS